MPDFSNMSLGKGEPKRDPRTLCFASYTADLAPAPAQCDQTGSLTDLGGMKNDALGDCTCAAVGHVIQLWTANNGAQVILSDDQIVSLYEQFGYKPDDPDSDQGAAELDVLNYWRKNGVYGHTLEAYADINPKMPQEVRDAVYYFGASYIGVALPKTAKKQDIWDVVPNAGADGDPNSWGGHAIPVVAYDDQYLTCITWGSLLKMTWEFFAAYCDEAHVPLGPDWIGQNGTCPAGFDLAALQADLKAITSA